MSEYTPEAGQALFGCPRGQYSVPDYGCALLEWLMKETERIFWNREQREWDRYEDPRIPGNIFRAYYWGEDDRIAALPNYTIDGDPLEIRWYKHSWRGLTATHEYTPAQWVAWFTLALAHIHKEGQRDRR